MKTSLRLSILAVAFAAVTSVFAADRWSSDEMAVRMGVNSWLTLWTQPTPAADSVKSLYATRPSDELSAAVKSAPQPLPSAIGQPGRVAVNMQGDRATTTFNLNPERRTLIVLTWERRDGLWRIVQETIISALEPTERVALSEPARK